MPSIGVNDGGFSCQERNWLGEGALMDAFTGGRALIALTRAPARLNASTNIVTSSAWSSLVTPCHQLISSSHILASLSEISSVLDRLAKSPGPPTSICFFSIRRPL